MTLEEYKREAERLLGTMDTGDLETDISDMLGDDVTSRLNMSNVKPVLGKKRFIAHMFRLREVFPHGFNFTVETVIAEEGKVAVQTRSDTVAVDGQSYANRHHFYI